jgi:KTSC domain
VDRIKVQSSNIESVGWENETMVVEFKPKKEEEAGRLYQYEGVNYDTYRAFINAPSVGSHFHAHIRNNYQGHRIDTPKKEEQRHGENKEGEEGTTRKTIS